MKWLTGIITALILTFTLSAEETIRLSTGEWSPFISKDLKHHGLVMRIIKESFALEGVKVEYDFFPWGRAEKLVEEGYRDGIAVQTYSPDYLNSDVVIQDELVFFHLKNRAFNWHSFEDLKGIVIGGVIANTYGSEITQMEKKGEITIERVPTEVQNLKKLLLKRIQITPMGMAFGYSLLRKHFDATEIERITHNPNPIRVSQYRLALSSDNEKNKKMIQLFNSGLKKLKASGSYALYVNESRDGKYIVQK